jgi:hypothetical protein
LKNWPKKFTPRQTDMIDGREVNSLSTQLAVDSRLNFSNLPSGQGEFENQTRIAITRMEDE